MKELLEMTFHYCERYAFGDDWSDQPHGAVVDEYSESEAQRRHEANQYYCAAIGSRFRASYSVSLLGRTPSSGRLMTVCFGDVHHRAFLEYTFNEIEPGRVFLSRSVFRTYVDVTDQLATVNFMNFLPDGSVKGVDKDKLEETARSFTSTNPDVSAHWDIWPEFGEYDSLCRADRDRPVQKGWLRSAPNDAIPDDFPHMTKVAARLWRTEPDWKPDPE